MSVPPPFPSRQSESPPIVPHDWPVAYRIIRTIYPPVWLFEDIADPADWELIANAEAKTNPRVRDQIGDLRLVPAERRIAGPGASYAMAAFTHVSPDRTSRFSAGSYGVWYCGDRLEVALMETAHHFARFMRRTEEPPANAQFRELNAAVSGALHTLNREEHGSVLDPDDWRPGQALAARLRAGGSDGIAHPSVRWPDGTAAALFWPDLIKPPVVQARTLHYHWNGSAVTGHFIIGEDEWRPFPGEVA